jgi:predicted metal-dependent phosphotriesterase family hydrolase
VAIGHLGGLTDAKAEVQKAICKRGAFVGFNRQGGPGDADQVPAIMTLLAAGYAGQLLFSSDFSFASDLKRSGGAGYAMTCAAAPDARRQSARCTRARVRAGEKRSAIIPLNHR